MAQVAPRRALIVLGGALGLITLLTNGCAGGYIFRGHEYSRELFLEAVRKWTTQEVSTIQPTQTPVGGRALYVAPSREAIQNQEIRVHGGRSVATIAYSVLVTPVAIDTLVTATEITFQAYLGALQRRQIFQNIAVVESKVPESVRMPEYEVSIYPLISGPNQLQWFLATSSDRRPHPLYYDTSLPEGGPRLLSWLESIERLAREHLRR